MEITDRLAIYVIAAYGNVEAHTGITLLVATIFFAFQIYCDFAGHSYFAIGCAREMGFKLIRNFNHPYLAASIDEFWKRWHISLSTWFRDYLYIPLGGNWVSTARWYFNLFFIFIVSGFWHGANWTYVIWGGLNGFYLVFALVIAGARKSISGKLGLSAVPHFNHVLQVITTFAFVCIAWTFFRANPVQEVVMVLNKIIFERGAIFTGGRSCLDSLLPLGNSFPRDGRIQARIL